MPGIIRLLPRSSRVLARICALLLLGFWWGVFGPALAQNDTSSETIAIAPNSAVLDDQIEDRLVSIFSQVNDLNRIKVQVSQGVVFLDGEALSTASADRAADIARRLEGVVTVENNVEQVVGVEDNVSPLLESTTDWLNGFYRSMPLLAISVATFLLIAFIGHLIASWRGLWQRLLPNHFLADLIAGAFRVASIVVALVICLNILGASTLLGTILGGAGVVGIALGFAVRDTLENYISSVMLSIRQPFRANEHVVINEHEGKVVRLTSRSTVLMTLNGNHLRIPNSVVFKAVILNYTRNPERRFEFDLGVDANDDPVAAMQLGLNTLKSLDYVLDNPDPEALILTVGDSNIVLRFMGWVDQEQSNFGKARGLAISATKDVLEREGFTLPEPIYRLRFDSGSSAPDMDTSAVPTNTPEPPSPSPNVEPREATDIRPDQHIDMKVNQERAIAGDEDLLDEQRPVE